MWIRIVTTDGLGIIEIRRNLGGGTFAPPAFVSVIRLPYVQKSAHLVSLLLRASAGQTNAIHDNSGLFPFNSIEHKFYYNFHLSNEALT